MSIDNSFCHKSVLLQESVACFSQQMSQPGAKVFVDGTAGGGGHSRALVAGLGPLDRLFLFDRDPAAIATLKSQPSLLDKRVTMIDRSFDNLDAALEEHNVHAICGVLLDLGLSSFQLDASGRGFSFMRDEPLDMRADPRSGITCAELLQQKSEPELTQIIKEYGEERWAPKIAYRICKMREEQPLLNVTDLVAAVKRAIPSKYYPKHHHVATRTFMALRIAVNGELDALPAVLEQASSLLVPGGIIAIITFHSLEDRIVKHFFKKLASGCVCPVGMPICTCNKTALGRAQKAIVPNEEAIRGNPRSRSARLRIFERF